ncbi:hypothetical protein [Methanococcoides burtonii]|uniref:hypothetical protein n=1 Tax=Methanococcoides burtonii TaxID=29291 RepID=UPI000045E171|nr:hypothetical protein [Methanococcoides burtonii]
MDDMNLKILLELYSKNEYNVKQTSLSGAQRADLILVKDRIKVTIQPPLRAKIPPPQSISSSDMDFYEKSK